MGTSIRGRELMILLTMSAPSFMLQLDANIVSVSLPSIAHSLNASFAGIEWVITAYTLVFASLLLPAGALADRFGRKPLLIIGISIFTLASLVCGLAPGLAILVAARALQGAGAAALLSAALATLSHSFQGAARARAFAIWGAVIGIGMAVGPIVGGVITQYFGWEWAFYVNVPVGVVLIAAIILVVGSSRDPGATKLDIPGVITFSGSLFLATLALISGNRDGWTDRLILTELVCSLALFILFIIVEVSQSRAMLDLTYFRHPTFLGASFAQLAFAAGLMTMLTFLPLYFQSGLRHAPASAGLMMMPLVVPLFIMPFIVSRLLAHRMSGRGLLTVGLLIVAAGLAWLAFEASSFNYSALIGGMVVIGIGAGILNGETPKVGMTVIPAERAGMASGLTTSMRFSGLVLGFALLGAILFGRILSVVSSDLSELDPGVRSTLARRIAAGDLSGADAALPNTARLQGVALESFGAGYQAVLISAAILSLIAAALVWRLVQAKDVPPLKRELALSRT